MRLAWRLSVVIAAALLLAACATPVREPEPVPDRRPAPGPAKPPGELVDGAPDVQLDVSRIRPVVPGPEPRSPYGNHSPYSVLGQTYYVKPTAIGYRELGIASWYGTKFHGRMTSSGEPYDMFQMTAAHKTLPLPTYAEVRHLENGRSIIVRINDRGPFHSDRIIDLSWAAAVKLGIDQAGTAPVEVRAITFDEPEVPLVRPARLPVYLQVGAFSDRERADNMARTLGQGGIAPVRTQAAVSGNGRVYRVQIGPLNDLDQTFQMLEQVVELGFDRPQYVYP